MGRDAAALTPSVFRPDPVFSHLLNIARDAAIRAGQAVMDVYGQDFEVFRKADASPVTIADEHAEAIIVEALTQAAPGIPIIAEEHAARNGLPQSAPPRFWLVDPIDGTKEFIARNGEFTVNIALIENGIPVLGIIHVPVTLDTYIGAGPGAAWHEGREDSNRNPLSARAVPDDGIVVLHSRSHANHKVMDGFLSKVAVASRRICGSSIKFCFLAEGAGDLYPRFGPTMEWDTAAGQAILESAGGAVTTLDGARLLYGKPGFLNPHFLARGIMSGPFPPPSPESLSPAP